MNIQQYIASGILEQYALGLTTEQESQEVESYVLQYPEIAKELDAIQSAMELLVSDNARSPRPGLEEELMNRLETNPLPDNPSPDIPSTPRSLPITALLLAGLLLALGLMVYQFFQAQKVQQELEKIQLEKENVQGELDQLKIDCAALQDTASTFLQYANIVGDPGNQTVVMNGQEIAPTALASVYWNPNRAHSFLEIKNLPTPPSGKQYQLWAIVRGKPVDMGVFELDLTPGKLQEVPFIENPQAFAITLEEEGGSPSPTLDQMYVLGNKS